MLYMWCDSTQSWRGYSQGGGQPIERNSETQKQPNEKEHK